MPLREFTKIGTCSYCSARTVLKLQGANRLKLACASCGAPLQEMKSLKVDRHKAKLSHRNRPVPIYDRARRKRSDKPKKFEFWEELWDGIEDIVEEIFD